MKKRKAADPRHPTLTAEGRKMLELLREHPKAPIYRDRSGSKLTAEEVPAAAAFERRVLAAEVGWRPGEVPPWVGGFIEKAYAEVPFYRRLGTPPARLEDVPPVGRGDLSRDIAAFVPDPVPLDRMLCFTTSGTTGHPLAIPSHPMVAAGYLAFHRRALRRFGIEIRGGRGRVWVVLAGFQRRCFTYVSVTPTLGEAGLAKLNLHPDDWRHPGDRAAYLDDLAPELFTGDPISLAELARLPLRHRPRAILSTSMALLPGLRARLEERFRCPVLDIYSMNEAGPIAVGDPAAGGHVLLQDRLFVEILDAAGRPAQPGERGEIALTGGFNPCLPLLRYRTGDFGALRFARGEPVLAGLEGRPPVTFRTAAGERINNIEATRALGRFAIPRFALHQDRRGRLRLRLAGEGHDIEGIRGTLLELFGKGTRLAIEEGDLFEGKVVQYTSELTEP